MSALTATAPLHLKRLSGEILTIYPEGAQDPRDLAFVALPDGERPSHVGKIRIISSEDPEQPSLLWIDATEQTVDVEILGSAYDRHTYEEYAIGMVNIREDGRSVYRRHFYYRAPQQQPILYRKQDVIEIPRQDWRDEDEIEIPAGAQPMVPSDFLPVEWQHLEEEWKEEFERFRREVAPIDLDAYQARLQEEMEEEQDQDQ